MTFSASKYEDGQEIRAGDIFTNNGLTEFQVIAVVSLERSEYMPGHEEWLEVIRHEHGQGYAYLAPYGIVVSGHTNEDIVLLRRNIQA